MYKYYFFIIYLVFSTTQILKAQRFFDGVKKNYEIGGIVVKGNAFSDEKAIIGISGLRVGQKISIPGSEISGAIKSIYKQRLFSNVEIVLAKEIGDVAMLEILVQEKPRYSKHTLKGVKKSAHDELNELVNSQLIKNSIVTEDVKENIIFRITDYYVDKGYLDARVNIHEFKDDKKDNAVRLVIDINKGKRIKISNITFEGNEHVRSMKLRKKMKETKRLWQVFSKSKFIEDEYEMDKNKIVSYYNTKGYRDAQILSDSIWRTKNGRLRIHLNIEEGKRYYYRNIFIKGNSLYSEDQIRNVLAIQRGDIYNQELLQKRLSFNQDGRDVSSLYMDEGYLFFRADPVEVGIEKDSVDIELRIVEGAQATIDRVKIIGNDRTNEHVVRREIRTKPGQKFSRSDVIRSQRAIMALGYFNPETMGMNTPVNPKRGTVDIEYSVEERPSDQLELSAGWSAYGLIGTLGVVFNNFSTRNFFKKDSWSPLPQGDGQKLSLRAQTNGKYYQSYNFSFTEPWLGGKKPNSFTLAGVYSLINQELSGAGKVSILRFSGGLGSQLTKPDDNFISSTALNLERIRLTDYYGFRTDNETVSNGDFYNISLKQTIARTTVSDPLFPRSGSRISLSGQFTLPYSLFRKNWDPATLSSQDKFRWVEYHKWRFDGEWYFNLISKLVFSFNAKMGLIGYYNKKLGVPPFERVQVGGDGLNNQSFTITGRDIISLRGYEVAAVKARNPEEYRAGVDRGDATIFNKFTAELRYPLSLNPSASIYVLGFLQGANGWYSFKEYNPFDLKRSVGVGARVFLPMFGLLGFDYGFGIDQPWLKEQNAGWKSYGKFSLILGFEPE